MEKKDILFAIKIIILIAVVSGNLWFVSLDYRQEHEKMNCITGALYNHTTKLDFSNCLGNAGWYNADTRVWLFLSTSIIVISILIEIIIEGLMSKKTKNPKQI